MREPRLYEIARFSRELGSLLRLGYPVLEAVELLQDQVSFSLAPAVQRLREGDTLTRSLQPLTPFDGLYLRLLEAAETGEILPEGLERASEVLEMVAERKAKIFMGLLYPALLVTLTTILALLLCGGLGQFMKNMFETMHVQVPAATRVFFQLSDAAFHPLGLLLYLVPSAALWYFALGKGPVVRWRYKVPLFGDWLRREEAALYLHTLSQLTAVGTPLTEATRLAAQVLSPALRETLQRVPHNLEKGDTLGQALSKQNLLPETTLWALERKEKMGQLELEPLARLVDRDLEISLGTGLIIFEPLALLLLATFMGFLIASVIAPMYSLLQGI